MTPGGSSGGAAVAAASGAGLLHLGTDGGGSIRIPCSFTGLTGIKPTYGRIAAYPVSAFGTVAHLGPMTRRVADSAAMLSVMCGRDTADWLQGAATLPCVSAQKRSFKGARIGYWRSPPCGRVHPEVAMIVERTVAALEAMGADVEPFELPATDLLETFNVLWFSGAVARLSLLEPEQRMHVDPELLQAIEPYRDLPALTYLKANSARVDFGRRMDELLTRFDLVISPTTTIPAFEVDHLVPPGSGYGSWTEWAGFSFPINLTQQPAATVPCGLSAGGLPIGLQMIAGRGLDSTVLAYAAAFEDAFPERFL